LVVKAINVAQASSGFADNGANSPGSPPPVAFVPQPQAPAAPRLTPEEAFRRRYGAAGFPATPAAPAAQTPAAYAPATPRGLPIVLDEKELSVTLVLVVIKPAPPAAK
ncbi:MAG TPA: hypothetical protein VHH88_09225, partial [Verrucomicrobiae bacterium]|nr:hypothetical protein [Verrucomicrobiae bacterium]